MWELDYKESWAPKNWCFELWCWRRLWRVPWTARRSNQSMLKGDQSWVFIGRIDAEAETPILWPPHAKSWLIGKDPGAGRDWGQEEKGTTENEIVEWHHRLDGHEFEWTLGFRDGQGGLACCDSWGRKESDTTERLNWTELKAFDCVDHNKLWEALKEMGISYHFICVLRNLCVRQQATVRTLYGTDWFSGLRKEYNRVPYSFN